MSRFENYETDWVMIRDEGSLESDRALLYRIGSPTTQKFMRDVGWTPKACLAAFRYIADTLMGCRQDLLDSERSVTLSMKSGCTDL